MAAMKVKHRKIGAKASISRFGSPSVQSAAGGEMAIVTAASGGGFNPVDLLFASLASCLALSVRVAASELQLINNFSDAVVEVTGEKVGNESMRVQDFDVRIKVFGNLSEADIARLVERAEEICTVSNSLKTTSTIHLTLE